jgi:hypothetical protein
MKDEARAVTVSPVTRTRAPSLRVTIRVVDAGVGRKTRPRPRLELRVYRALAATLSTARSNGV